MSYMIVFLDEILQTQSAIYCTFFPVSRVQTPEGVSLENDQIDTHLLYFTIRPLQSSTCFEHYILIIRRLNCIDAASGIVLSVSGRPVHRLRENCIAVLSQPVHRTATD